MPNFSKVRTKLLSGNINLLGDTLKLLLVRNSYNLDVNHEFLSSVIAHDLVDAGYTAGGLTLSGKSLVDVNSSTYLRASNLSLNIAGNVSIKWGILYKSTGTNGTSPLISYFVFDPEKVVIGAPLNIIWDSLGILKLQS